MSISRSWARCLVCGLALLALAAAPAMAKEAMAKDVIQAGTDFWITAGDGMTFTSFSQDPLPAGFFCAESQAWSGRVQLKGVPLTAEPAGSLGAVDTIINRLHDAELDEKGFAYTPIQLWALSLQSAEPIATACGSYDVKVALAGRQPVTYMRIARTSEYGGTYSAPLALNVQVAFEPVAGNPNPRVAIQREIKLGDDSMPLWTWQDPGQHQAVKVDTNGDGTVDAKLPMPSNFLAGVAPVSAVTLSGSNSWTIAQPVPGPVPVPVCPRPLCPYQACHCNPDPEEWDPHDEGDGCADNHWHCKWVCVHPNTGLCGVVIQPDDVVN